MNPQTKPQIEQRELAKLIPYARNARTHSEAQVALIAGSIREFGFTNPVLVWRDEIVAGHGRVLAAARLGLDRVPCVALDHLTDTQRRAYVLADNRLAELSGWDESMLELEVQALADADVDVTALGFDEPSAEDPAGDGSVDDVEIPVGEPVSVLGAWYELGPHRLYCGSSLDVEAGDPKVMIFDPPFDVDYLAWPIPQSIDVCAVWGRGGSWMKWIVERFPNAVLPKTGDESRDADGWGMHSLVFTGGVRGQHNHTLPACMHEVVTVLRRKWWADKMEALDRDVLEKCGAKVCTDGRHYSWQEGHGGVLTNVSHGMSWGKPIFEMEVVLAYAPRGCEVWDPCAGSGSSLLAAATHGRVWRGCEVQPRWADLIRRRWTRWAKSQGVPVGSGGLDG